MEFAVRNSIPHFINIDSYFNKPGNSYEHLIDYSNSKRALSLWFPFFSERIKITNIVLEHVYGPYDSQDKFVPMFLTSALTKFKDGSTYSQGGQVRDFIYVEDVASALLAIVNSEISNLGLEQLNLGTSIGTSLRDFGKLVCDILEVEVNPPFGSGPYRRNEIMASVANLTSMSKFKWEPRFSLEQGIRETIKHMGAI